MARQDVINFQFVQLSQAAQGIGGAEVDAAGVTQHAARHDEIAEGDEGFAEFFASCCVWS
jgi:hypothetical protein